MRKYYYKLVRDKIPDIIFSSNKCSDAAYVDGDCYRRLLDMKLYEELQEFYEEKSLEELADLVEVIYATAVAYGYTIEELEKVRQKKLEEKGGFEKRILLKSVY